MTLDVLPRLYMPVIISDMNGKIIWFNKAFCNVSGTKNAYFGKNIDQFCSNSLDEIIQAQNSEEGLDTVAFNRFYRVKAYAVKTSNKSYCITVWNNRDELNAAYDEMKNENTVVTALVSKEEVQASEIDHLVKHKFGDSLPAFVAAFAKHRKLSKADIDAVQAMIDQYRKENTDE
jgi:c-di-AMP phosphodiesterase-like protein